MRFIKTRLELIPLEDRTVPASLTVNLNQNVLRIFGTDAADTILLRYANGSYTVDGVTGSIPASQVRWFEVVGLGGNDSIDLRNALVAVHANAGAGDDRVVAGRMDDTVVGGAGDDTVWAGGGNDAADGGDGNDRLYGEAGNDSLIGGAGTNTLDGGPGRNTVVDRVVIAPTPTGDDYYARAFADGAIESLVRMAAADNLISRGELLGVYTQAGRDGTVSAAEMNDLVRIVRPVWTNVPTAQQYGMADSTRVLGLMVAEGDVANATYQGRALGNLAAGSSATQLQKLASKWFLGQDRPTASGTYREVSGSLFQNGASYRDVDQGGVGDCYLTAALGEIAQTYPTSLQQMFTDNGDGTFTVRFFRDGSARYVTVDRYLPVGSTGQVVYAAVGGRYDSAANELWVALAEKAYAQIDQSGWLGHGGNNSYAAIEAGYSDAVFEQVVGRPAGWTWFYSSTAARLISLASGPATVLATKLSGTQDGVVPSHAYGLLGYNAGTGRFQLYNPWGSTIELTYTQIVASFNGFWTVTG